MTYKSYRKEFDYSRPNYRFSWRITEYGKRTDVKIDYSGYEKETGKYVTIWHYERTKS